MGFFDNLKSSLAETGQDLSQKAKDTTEIFRLTNLNKTIEKEIEKASQTQIKDFDKSKELVGKYLSTDYSSSTIDNYRRKLKKI